MSNELQPRRGYVPVPRTSDASNSAVGWMLKLRGDAMLDRARIAAETASVKFQTEQRIDAGIDLAAHLAKRAGELNAAIAELGNDPELYQLAGFIKAGATEAIISLMQGPPEPQPPQPPQHAPRRW